MGYPTEHFNQLTAAQLERLAILGEEMGEAAQIIGKIIRHGFESYDPTKPGDPRNRQLLEKELGHVRHAMIRLCDAGDLKKARIHAFADSKAESIGQWLHHQTDRHSPHKATTATLPLEASDEMAASVSNIVSPYAAKKIWARMAEAALLAKDGK